MTLNVICKDVILFPNDISILKNNNYWFNDINWMPDVFQKSIAYILDEKEKL